MLGRTRLQLFHNGREVPFRRSLSVGRDGTDLIFAEDEKVSRKHLLFRRRRSSLIATDLDSTNGSFVNGQRIKAGAEQILNDGDELRVGRQIFAVRAVAISKRGLYASLSLLGILVCVLAILDFKAGVFERGLFHVRGYVLWLFAMTILIPAFVSALATLVLSREFALFSRARGLPAVFASLLLFVAGAIPMERSFDYQNAATRNAIVYSCLRRELLENCDRYLRQNPRRLAELDPSMQVEIVSRMSDYLARKRAARPQQ